MLLALLIDFFFIMIRNGIDCLIYVIAFGTNEYLWAEFAEFPNEMLAKNNMHSSMQVPDRIKFNLLLFYSERYMLAFENIG